MIFLLLLLLAVPARAADPIDGLIEDQKAAADEWSGDTESPPDAMLWGDKNAVEIFSAAAGASNVVCQQIEFDELIELSRGNPKDAETVLNLDLPRVREILQQNCLIGPKDTFTAVGEGSQSRVTVKDFVVRRERPVCPQDSPYSLWARFNQPLTDTPIFFSTNNTWPEGGNTFVRLQESRISDPASPEYTLLAQQVKDIGEFDVWKTDLRAPNADSLYVCRRKITNLDDDGAPNEMLLVKTNARIEELFVERINATKGSGHLKLESSLDYNGDGLADLVISGVHEGCPYTMVFEGRNTSFSQSDLPIKPCGC